MKQSDLLVNTTPLNTPSFKIVILRLQINSFYKQKLESGETKFLTSLDFPGTYCTTLEACPTWVLKWETVLEVNVSRLWPWGYEGFGVCANALLVNKINSFPI